MYIYIIRFIKKYKQLICEATVKKKVTLSIDDKVYQEFQKYCEDNAIMLSKKVEIWIEEFLQQVKGGKVKK